MARLMMVQGELSESILGADKASFVHDPVFTLLPAAPGRARAMPQPQKSLIGDAVAVTSPGLIEVIKKGGLLRKPGLALRGK